MNVIINNQETFKWNSSIHNINTRNKHHLHAPDAKLSCFQKSTFYSGIKIFNSLWSRVSFLKNDKVKFKAASIKYLRTQSFYSVDEIFLCVKIIYNIFVKCFWYFTPYICVCVFMTSSTSDCLHDTLMDQTNVCMYACIYLFVVSLISEELLWKPSYKPV